MLSKEANLVKILINQIGQPALGDLYDCLRSAVYGLPGTDSPSIREVVHLLAEKLHLPDPSSDSITSGKSGTIKNKS